MRFYLGTHQPSWLRAFTVPLFISHRRLVQYRTLPKARCRWALDSGAFSELSQYGRWPILHDLGTAMALLCRRSDRWHQYEGRPVAETGPVNHCVITAFSSTITDDSARSMLEVSL